MPLGYKFFSVALQLSNSLRAVLIPESNNSVAETFLASPVFNAISSAEVAEVGDLLTVIVKAASLTGVDLLSLTAIVMSLKLPTSQSAGLPLNCPVFSSKLAQLGLLRILKLNVSPSRSLAFGLKK